ncbi:MAG: McrC family protein [Elusimicrobiota bacterium]|jgi:5-methylcytosine-specific restriction enzyme subunit McrC|nr:McrC family protein [Elusimicrobiota bacterium]
MKYLEIAEYGFSKEKLDSDFLLSFKTFLKDKRLENTFSFDIDRIKASSHVGVIQFKGVQINVLPKILVKEEDRKRILDNLIFMLSYTKRLNVKITGSAIICKSKNPFLEILISAFADSLLNALLTNIPHAYETQNENLRFIKGKIDFKNNIKYNSFNHSRIFCVFDEFKEDNLLNQVFKFVTEFLLDVSKIIETKRKLTNILAIYDDVSQKIITSEIAGRVKLRRGQNIFETPLKLAKLFIDHSFINLDNNRFESIALLFDMNKLFEEFVFSALRHSYGNIVQAQFSKHMLNSLRSGQQHLPFKKNTRSDIYINKHYIPPIIIDTKYKLIDSSNDLSMSDIYQMMAYAHVYKTNSLILLYPQSQQKFNHTVVFHEDVAGIKDLNIQVETINLSSNLKNKEFVFELKNIIERISQKQPQ